MTNGLRQAAEHEADHGEADESDSFTRVTLKVFGKAAAGTNPSEGALDDPAFREDDEAMHFVALDDLQRPGAGLGDGVSRLCALIAGIGKDTFNKGVHSAGAPIENQARAVSILHVGRMNDDVQQEAKRVDEDVPLATFDFLARVVARRINRRPPFWAPLALWASMIAAVGLASRPACSRTAR